MGRDENRIAGKPGQTGREHSSIGDWREAAARALRSEASRRGLGESYDTKADAAGIAAALFDALTRWRRASASTPGKSSGPLAVVLADAPPPDLLYARSMRCPTCMQTGGRFILALADGHVVALDGDLAYACPEGEALAQTSALCSACGETAPLADYR